MHRLRQEALDIITPLLGQRVPFITVQQIIDALRSSDQGIVIDRELVMQLLNPDEVKAVSKINGDRIFLAKSAGPAHEGDKEKDAKQVAKAAQQQAKKETEQ